MCVLFMFLRRFTYFAGVFWRVTFEPLNSRQLSRRRQLVMRFHLFDRKYTPSWNLAIEYLKRSQVALQGSKIAT